MKASNKLPTFKKIDLKEVSSYFLNYWNLSSTRIMLVSECSRKFGKSLRFPSCLIFKGICGVLAINISMPFSRAFEYTGICTKMNRYGQLFNWEKMTNWTDTLRFCRIKHAFHREIYFNELQVDESSLLTD